MKIAIKCEKIIVQSAINTHLKALCIDFQNKERKILKNYTKYEIFETSSQENFSF